MSIAFEHIFIDREVSDLRIPNHVTEYFSDQEIVEVDGFEEIKKFIDRKDSKSIINSGKKLLYLNNYKGDVIKYCPAKSPGEYLCCDLHTINLMSNCVFNCAYCILQACLTNPVMQVHCNLDHIFSELDKFDDNVNQTIRICTGEVADSLALDNILHQNEYLVNYFANCKNLYLELKTKSSAIENLLKVDPKGRTVVSFSLNPEAIVNKIELHTSSLKDRLIAARQLISAGYHVAFNIDPVLYYEGWKQDYGELFVTLKEQFEPGEIAWMHLGLLRYIPGLAGIARQRFPGIKIFDQEFVQGPDRKYRYPKPIRDEIYAFLYESLGEWDFNMPRYSCVEQSAHWRKFHPHIPENTAQVNKQVLQRLI